MVKINVLFICSRNKWRSLTAEEIFKKDLRFNVRSAGTENSARIRVSEKMINWADLLFVMEKSHKQKLVHRFGESLSGKQIIVLDIPDIYEYMDEELVQILKSSVEVYLGE
jgi:protein-tyrosine phosphatase